VSVNNFVWHNRFLQQAVWTRPLRDYLFNQIRLTSSMSILEVGCGTGAILFEIEARFQGRIFGVDIDSSFLHQASHHTHRSILLHSDAYALPFPSSAFDLTICHFLLLWVKDPVHVVREMKRITRPGGHVLALAEPDYGGRIDYPFELEALGRLQQSSLNRQGANTLIGRQLNDIFFQAGFLSARSGCLGGEWKLADSNMQGDSEWEMIEHDQMALNDSSSQEKLLSLKNLDQETRKKGTRVLFVPTFYALGKK
jgi:ubiquinone/menaquinone biosynthesis C-methylase UbiE